MRVTFSRPTPKTYDEPEVSEFIRPHNSGVGIFLNDELLAQHTYDGLILEGNLKADTQHGGKISFTLSHHAMSEAERDW